MGVVQARAGAYNPGSRSGTVMGSGQACLRRERCQGRQKELAAVCTGVVQAG